MDVHLARWVQRTFVGALQRRAFQHPMPKTLHVVYIYIYTVIVTVYICHIINLVLQSDLLITWFEVT